MMVASGAPIPAERFWSNPPATPLEAGPRHCLRTPRKPRSWHDVQRTGTTVARRMRGTRGPSACLLAMAALAAGCGGGGSQPALTTPTAGEPNLSTTVTHAQGIRAFCVLHWNLEPANADVRALLARRVSRGPTQVSVTVRKDFCTVTLAQNGRAQQFRDDIGARRSNFVALQAKPIAVASLPPAARDFTGTANQTGAIALPSPK